MGDIMAKLKIGDIVARKSYCCDILFKVVNISPKEKENIVTLKGICYRIQADAPESDLILQTQQSASEYKMARM
jgi:spore coat assemly protein